MQVQLNSREGFILGFLICLGLLGGAYIIEYGFHVEPCPLCVLQRMVFWGMGIVFLIGAFHNPKNKLKDFLCVILTVLGVSGILLATRQIWLQNLPLGEDLLHCGVFQVI